VLRITDKGTTVGQNIWKSPKAKVQAVAPNAKCVKDWSIGGRYRIDFGCAVKGFNGGFITSLKTSTSNPADAWAEAVFELRLDGFNRPHAPETN
jgi:hypothetical protein